MYLLYLQLCSTCRGPSISDPDKIQNKKAEKKEPACYGRAHPPPVVTLVACVGADLAACKRGWDVDAGPVTVHHRNFI